MELNFVLNVKMILYLIWVISLPPNKSVVSSENISMELLVLMVLPIPIVQPIKIWVQELYVILAKLITIFMIRNTVVRKIIIWMELLVNYTMLQMQLLTIILLSINVYISQPPSNVYSVTMDNSFPIMSTHVVPANN